MTNPSRSLSKGRLAVSGESMRVDSAFMEANPAMLIARSAASVPPARMTSASSRTIAW